ncbi:delta-like protein C [Haliotis rubra]|uniref:delta-like protein C n=1 Tax=Haliotis rubra TaxID=36100 RepID=UPI001EE57B3F|nr:delta-like protein C [Haliotis rubra]
MKVSCDNNPCLNEGTCEVKDGFIECTCKPGWGGDRCKLEPLCDADTDCLNGGTCDKSSDQYVCDCAPGYGGDTCNKASGAAKLSVHIWKLAVIAVLTKLSLN